MPTATSSPASRWARRRREALNQRAWFLVLPVFAIVLFSALLPLMTVVNYSVQDSFGNNQFFWNGIGWFQELMDPSSQLGERFFDSLWRNLLFSAIILLIEVPLGIIVALSMPRQGWTVSLCLVVMALPLLIPWNVVGTIWQVFGRGDIGLLGVCRQPARYRLQLHREPARGLDDHHRDGCLALDEPRRPPLLRRAQIDPDAYYQAARIDGASRWAVFRTIQLPKMRRVLLIAVLLRFMDSFMIYTEPFVLTGGGPGNATTFLSIDLVKLALGQFDLGKAAAMSLVYNLIILAMCWVFYTVMTNADADRGRRTPMSPPIRPPPESPRRARSNSIGGRHNARPCRRPQLYLLFLALPIYWLVNMSLKTNSEITTSLTLWPRDLTLANYTKIFTDSSWYSGYINSLKYVILNTLISIALALPAAYAFSRYRFIGDKHLFFWLLSNRMAPPAVFALPFFNLYSAIGLFDTPWAVALAHCLFNVPLAVWILEGFMSGVPREIDETAAIDGYSFPRFFVKIFMPLIASGIGVAAFFCFMFSWVELLLARTLTSVSAKPISATMTRTVSAAGMDWGLLAAAGVLTIFPGALVIWFVRNYIAKGFALGRV